MVRLNVGWEVERWFRHAVLARNSHWRTCVEREDMDCFGSKYYWAL